MPKDSLVINLQSQIEVYVNQGGGVTICETDYNGEESVVSFRAEHVDAICRALQECKNEIERQEIHGSK